MINKPPSVDTSQDPWLTIFGPSTKKVDSSTSTKIDTTYVDKRTEILNNPGGNKNDIQFNSGSSFSGDDTFNYDPTSKTLKVSGNVIVGGYVKGKITTNPFNFRLTGGTDGQVLTTDGTGNLTWANISVSTLSYANSNVADYLPTHTGDINGSNLTLSGTFNTNVNQLKIAGGVNGQVLTTNGNGTVTFESINTVRLFSIDGGSSTTFYDSLGLNIDGSSSSSIYNESDLALNGGGA